MKGDKRTPGKPTARIAAAILAAALFWLGIFFISLRIGGGGLTVFYDVPPEAAGYEILLEPEGIVRVEKSEISADGTELSLSLLPEGRGTAQLTLCWPGVKSGGFYEPEITGGVRVLPGDILFDELTWNFSGWEMLTACMSLFLLTAALIFYLASRREKRRTIFSYRGTEELGLAIFLLAAGLLRLNMLLAFLRGENGGTVWSLLVSTIVTAQSFMRQTAVVITGFAVITAASNFVLIRHEGMRPSNMLGIGVSLAMVGGAAFGIWMSRSMLVFPLRNVLVNVYAGVFVYLECLLAATVIRAVEAGRHEPPYDRDFVLVLGCRIRQDGTLYPLIRARVDRAIAFADAQLKASGKRAVLVPSGGQGADEPIPEAEAMARYMRQQGVPDKYILPETESKTTRENMIFSRRLIEARKEGARAAFSSSSYHVYRSGILALEEGWDIDGMGSRTKWYFWPNAFLREFIGLMAAGRVRQCTLIALIVAASAGVTMLVM